MAKNLVIVESPAKAKTIEKFLGKEYKVMSSYGHIRDLKKNELSLDKGTLVPCYEIPEEKQSLVKDLQSKAKKADRVLLASDEDREGEAISWHLCEVLGLDQSTTQRIVFHEITKPAIQRAIAEPRHLDMNLVNAQQARRVLDRIVGFKLSPVLWRKVKPGLSAGRVQSVAVKLIVEREREIELFASEAYYKVTAVFGKGTDEFRAEIDQRFATEAEAQAFLQSCQGASFVVKSVARKPLKRMPAPPFTTSTLQQEAARKLGFTVSQTMMVAQHLYENGHITYMRTDSVNLSSLAIGASKEEIVQAFGEEYSKPRKYTTRSRGAQEAHEAIRPTYLNVHTIAGTAQVRFLYDLIWMRTLASQMADAQLEKTVVTIGGAGLEFTATGEVVTFDGFIKVYHESNDDEETADSASGSSALPVLKKGDTLHYVEVSATEHFTQAPLRYTEASLVKKMEDLGIGRPSTYAPTISTIQQREYVRKGDSAGTERKYNVLTLSGDKLTQQTKRETVGKEKGKLVPTDIGTVVNDFLVDAFPDIMDYHFTANVEEKFDKIAEGKLVWGKMMKDFDKKLEPNIKSVLQSRAEHKAGERQIGNDPATGRPIYVKIGRFGPVVQIGSAGDSEKPRFAQIPKEYSMNTISVEQALGLFRLPRVVGMIDGAEATIGVGKYGPYICVNKQYISLPKGDDPYTVTLERCVEVVDAKKSEEAKRHIKTFSEDSKLEILNGRYGPYLVYDGKNYRLSRQQQGRAAELSYEECMAVVK